MLENTFLQCDVHQRVAWDYHQILCSSQYDPENFSILLHWVYDIHQNVLVYFTGDAFHIHAETLIQLRLLASNYLLSK